MLTDREQEIKNILIDHVGGSASYIGAQKALDRIDPGYLEMASRGVSVNKRRMIIFTILFLCVLLTAVAVMMATVGDYSVLLWVVVGAFNAVNAAIHYAEYKKKKLAFALFDALQQEDEK
jgi:hypothetical protein